MNIGRATIIKLLELAIVITCVCLHYQSLAERDDTTIMLASGTFVGYLVILIAVFAGNLINTPINKRLDLFYSLVGCAMFIAAGVLILKEWEDSIFKTDRRKMAIAKGSLSIVNGVLFLIDAVLAFRD